LLAAASQKAALNCQKAFSYSGVKSLYANSLQLQVRLG
jgi:hypothetical protein